MLRACRSYLQLLSKKRHSEVGLLCFWCRFDVALCFGCKFYKTVSSFCSKIQETFTKSGKGMGALLIFAILLLTNSINSVAFWMLEFSGLKNYFLVKKLLGNLFNMETNIG